VPAPRGNKNNLRHGIHSGGFDPSDLSALVGLIAEGLPEEPEVRRLAERAADAELSLRQLRAARRLHLGEWAEVSQASKASFYARMLAEVREVKEELRLIGAVGRDPECERLMARMQRGMARHSFASSSDDAERLALNAKKQARQLRGWQGLERRLTARRNLALQTLVDIRAMTM
jgi:hypothetical protein